MPTVDWKTEVGIVMHSTGHSSEVWRVRVHTPLSHLLLRKGWKIGFSSLVTSADPYPALPCVPELWPGLLQGWGWAQGLSYIWARQKITGSECIFGTWSIAESEKNLCTPTAKTWLTRLVFSNRSNLNYYSLKLKAFKEVVVNHPLQRPA